MSQGWQRRQACSRPRLCTTSSRRTTWCSWPRGRDIQVPHLQSIKKIFLFGEKYDFVLKIEDPAIRTLVQLALTQRDKLKVQLDTLKSQANITLDLRPLGTFPVKGSKPSTIERPAQLTESERGALLQAISPEFIQSQNWHIGESGEVRASNGRFVFDPRFCYRHSKNSWQRCKCWRSLTTIPVHADLLAGVDHQVSVLENGNYR